jgi:predicted O-methyltransferase YrrM
MKGIFLTAQYLRYLYKANGAHGIHSAFVFELYKNVILESRNYYDFQPIEHLRNLLLGSKETIEVVDFGARGGIQTHSIESMRGRAQEKKVRKVKDIAHLSSISPKKGRLLFRLFDFMKPAVIVELGTSLGISTLYQYKACPETSFFTLEGNPQSAGIASKNFNMLKANCIHLITGNFNDTLPCLLETLPAIDYVFFDGNHRKNATLDYFHGFLPKICENSVFVFDDIRWSQEMLEAWNEIILEKKATVTIDLFSMGLVFFRKLQEKEHFVLKF